MNRFGIYELATTKTTSAPGWAYVPDVAPQAASAALTTATLAVGSRKRAVRGNQLAAAISGADLGTRYDARVRKELEALDKDAHIPIPGGKGSRQTIAKHTPNVRKILQSAKTFANHLDDLVHAVEHNPQSVFFPTVQLSSGPVTSPSQARSRRRSSVSAQQNKDAVSEATSSPARSARSRRTRAASTAANPRSARSRRISTATAEAQPEADVEAQLQSKPNPDPDPELGREEPAQNVDLNVLMTDDPPAESDQPATEQQPVVDDVGLKIPLLTPLPPSSWPALDPVTDNNPLHVSRIPPPPTAEEIRQLVLARPLTWLEAQARWPADGGSAGISVGLEEGATAPGGDGSPLTTSSGKRKSVAFDLGGGPVVMSGSRRGGGARTATAAPTAIASAAGRNTGRAVGSCARTKEEAAVFALWGAGLSERAVVASRRRYFCDVCGYWGRVRCGKCGARVCALDCLETHRLECMTRYGL